MFGGGSLRRRGRQTNDLSAHAQTIRSQATLSTQSCNPCMPDNIYPKVFPFILHVYFLAYMPVGHGVLCLWRPEEGIGCPGTEVTDGCELPCRC